MIQRFLKKGLFPKTIGLSFLFLTGVLSAFSPIQAQGSDNNAKWEEVLKRLDALEQENRQLRQQVQALQAATSQKNTQEPETSFQEKVKNTVQDILSKRDEKEKSTYPKISLGANIFMNYTYDLSKGAKDKNGLDFSRVYLDSKTQLQDNLMARVTLDFQRQTGGTVNTPQEPFLKFAYLQYDLSKSLKFQVGQHPLPWIAPVEETLWTHRYQGPLNEDREGYMFTTDLGASLSGDLPAELGTFQVALAHGEGFKDPEVNKYKSFDGRVTFQPFSNPWLKPLQFSYYVELGNYDTGQDRLRNLGNIFYKGQYYYIGATGFIAKDPPSKLAGIQKVLVAFPAASSAEQEAIGWSVFGNLDLDWVGFKNGYLVARYDALDPSRRLHDDNHYRTITGVGYRWNKYVRTLLDWERTVYEINARKAGNASSSVIRIDTELKF